MARYLDMIDGPADLKKLHLDQLTELAQEIRDELIQTLSQTGGHLGPNLGVVELTLALHYVFDSPTDKFVFDVSHQGYVHKLLTGRRDRFKSIRQYNGLSGFLSRNESPHDCYGAGHAGTALSAALGMAVARDKKGSGEHIVAIAGDAALTCGVSFEALNNINHHTKQFIVVLNDNEWSIAKNVGAIATYLNSIVTDPRYRNVHQAAGRLIERLAGEKAVQIAKKTEEAIKSVILPSVIFEELGLHYYGPMDGHDLQALIRVFEFLKTQKYPILLHLLTKKGRGYKPAELKPDKFHGLGKFKVETGDTAPPTMPTYSEILGESLSKLAETNQKLIAITAAMPSGTGLTKFAQTHPDRFYDVGIAEEHAVLFACGLATQGFKPVCAIYSTFLQRAYDMIIHDVAIQNLPVIFCMDRAGFVGDDGPTHNGMFDIAYLRTIPNFVLMQPKDEEEFFDMLATATLHPGPVAIRYPRGSGTGVKPKEHPKILEIGKAEVVKHASAGKGGGGRRVAIFGLGNMLGSALEVANSLDAQGLSTAVINPRFIKPLDSEILSFFAQNSDLLITMEDHSIEGGFGSCVLDALNELEIQVPVIKIGWPDRFIEHGTIPKMRELHGLSSAKVIRKVQEFFKMTEGDSGKILPLNQTSAGSS